MCNRVRYKNEKRILCACNEIYCGELKLNTPERRGQTFLYRTSRSGKRLELKDLGEITRINYKEHHFRVPKSNITVDLSKEYQTIMGWGGAFTDATGQNLESLPESLRHKLIESYFGPYGLHYNFARVPIGGTDFSNRSYSYDDLNKPDYELRYWSLTKEDREYKIPYILEAIRLSKDRNVDLKLFASPWSPPAWMKSNNQLVRGHLKNDNQTYAAYAEYLMKFYDAYKKQGINFWGATVQNEPVAANLPIYFFNSLQMNNNEMIRFIGKFLGPAMEKRGYTKENFKLMVGDDSLGFINHQVPEVLDDQLVQKYVSGLAYHWYTSGPIVPYRKLENLIEKIKDKIEFIMMSEACEGSMPMHKKVKPGSWSRAVSYAEDIIEDLNRNTNAWIDWNMALDMKGGPNWSGNQVDSPILVDAENKQFYKQPMYYALAHFSRFMKAGSVRVGTERRDSTFGGHVKLVAVHNKDTHHVVLNILNKSDRDEKININIRGLPDDGGFKLNEFVADKKSITTVMVKL